MSEPVLPEPAIHQHGPFRVLRDDLIRGGTKVRVLIEVLHSIDAQEIVYAADAYGYGALALAEACRRRGRDLSLFYPRVPVRPPASYVHAVKQPHVRHRELRTKNLQIEVAEAARRYAKAQSNAYFFPVGFDFPEFFAELVGVIRRVPIDPPEEVWTVGGSGCLARALATAWPEARVCVVDLGFPQFNAGDRAAVMARAEQGVALYRPPFPSAEYYDAKLWRVVLEQAQPGALIWNVAG